MATPSFETQLKLEKRDIDAGGQQKGRVGSRTSLSSPILRSALSWLWLRIAWGGREQRAARQFRATLVSILQTRPRYLCVRFYLAFLFVSLHRPIRSDELHREEREIDTSITHKCAAEGIHSSDYRHPRNENMKTQRGVKKTNGLRGSGRQRCSTEASPRSISLCSSPDCAPPGAGGAVAAPWRVSPHFQGCCPPPRSRCLMQDRSQARPLPAGWGTPGTCCGPGSPWTGSGRGSLPGWPRCGWATPPRGPWAAACGQMTGARLSLEAISWKDTTRDRFASKYVHKQPMTAGVNKRGYSCCRAGDLLDLPVEMHCRRH